MQAKAHFNFNVVAPHDVKEFWEVFKISPDDFYEMGQLIRVKKLEETGTEVVGYLSGKLAGEANTKEWTKEELRKAIQVFVYKPEFEEKRNKDIQSIGTRATRII